MNSFNKTEAVFKALTSRCSKMKNKIKLTVNNKVMCSGKSIRTDPNSSEIVDKIFASQ